jgi:hypothetical protein
MIQIMANIIAYINAKAPELGEIDEDFFVSTGDEVMCRHDPAPLVTAAYMDGSSERAFAFSFYSRAGDPATARQACERIIELLDLDEFKDFLGLSSGRIVDMTIPSPVSREEGGAVTYTSSFRLEYEEGL